MVLLVQLVGAALVLLALVDVFMTVLYARSGTGLLTPHLNKAMWFALKAAAPQRQPVRDAVLSFAGPLIMVATAALWILLLLVGFALVTWPALGSSIQASSGPTPTDFVAAIYYSGYSLTTLGTGDLVPQSSGFRLLMTIEAIVGFSILTLTLAYFMSVYSALIRRNTLAQALHLLSGGTGDAAELIARLGPEGSFDDSRSLLAQLAIRVLNLLEAHHSYPVLHYFRMHQRRYAMARLAFVTMDTATLLRTALGDEHQLLAQSASVDLLRGSGATLLEQTGNSFLRKGATNHEASKRSDEFDSRFQMAVERLERAGISTVQDRGSGQKAYADERQDWDESVRAFASFMGYSWHEIDVATKHGATAA